MGMEKITLATLPQATAQQVFDQVAKHLLTQGRKSIDREWGMCMYRGDSGAVCAAGCLILDAEYKKEMEEKSWFTLATIGWVPPAHSSLIDSLQSVHDHSIVEEWLEKLKEVAIQHNLNTDAL